MIKFICNICHYYLNTKNVTSTKNTFSDPNSKSITHSYIAVHYKHKIKRISVRKYDINLDHVQVTETEAPPYASPAPPNPWLLVLLTLLCLNESALACRSRVIPQ